MDYHCGLQEHMAEVLGRIRSSELEEALLVLPLDVVIDLVKVIEQVTAAILIPCTYFLRFTKVTGFLLLFQIHDAKF